MHCPISTWTGSSGYAREQHWNPWHLSPSGDPERRVHGPSPSSMCYISSWSRVLPSCIILTASPHLPGLAAAAAVIPAPLAYKVVQCLFFASPSSMHCRLTISLCVPWLPASAGTWQELYSIHYLIFR